MNGLSQLIIKRYKSSIYNYSYYMLRNRMDADDITQEVLIRVWKNSDQHNLLTIKSWLMKVTHNLCIDYLRKRAVIVKRESSMDFILEEEADIPVDNSDPFSRIEDRSIADKIEDSLSKIPETLRSVFVLYELEGFKYREIAQMLDIPVNSVKVYLMRARIKLQEELKNYV